MRQATASIDDAPFKLISGGISAAANDAGVPKDLRVHLVNPSDKSFGVAVITPRWLYVLAAATPGAFHDPVICDESLEQLDTASIRPGDIVGIGIHTGNALRGYEVGKSARARVPG
jgi:hypothetical protein